MDIKVYMILRYTSKLLLLNESTDIRFVRLVISFLHNNMDDIISK